MKITRSLVVIAKRQSYEYHRGKFLSVFFSYKFITNFKILKIKQLNITASIKNEAKCFLKLASTHNLLRKLVIDLTFSLFQYKKLKRTLTVIFLVFHFKMRRNDLSAYRTLYTDPFKTL